MHTEYPFSSVTLENGISIQCKCGKGGFLWASNTHRFQTTLPARSGWSAIFLDHDERAFSRCLFSCWIIFCVLRQNCVFHSYAGFHSIPHLRWTRQFQEKPKPRSLRETNPLPKIKWSRQSTSRSFPAWTMALVTATSSGLGVGSWDGWL